jgi:Tetratricopeptide repeat
MPKKKDPFNIIAQAMAQLPPGELELLRDNMMDFLKDVGDEPSGSELALEEAQSLVWDAFDTDSKAKRVALAKKALELSDACADAYLILADDSAKSKEERASLIHQAVNAGAKAIEIYGHTENEGHFWGILETRPYMRALNMLALLHVENEALGEAISVMEKMLRLNPDDNQGMRYTLFDLLLRAKDLAKAKKLRTAYKDDDSAWWHYGTALLGFATEGNTARSNKLLGKATAYNHFVVPFLTAAKPLPKFAPDAYSPEQESEAVSYALDAIVTWRAIDGAIDWLRGQTKSL